MNKTLISIKIGIILSSIVLSYNLYSYYFNGFSPNEVREINKSIDIKRLPKIEYDAKSVDKLYNSINLKEIYSIDKK